MPLMVVPLRRGEHALTATLVFQGRNVGPFSYLGNYRYRVESTYSFYLERPTGSRSSRSSPTSRAG